MFACDFYWRIFGSFDVIIFCHYLFVFAFDICPSGNLFSFIFWSPIHPFSFCMCGFCWFYLFARLMCVGKSVKLCEPSINSQCLFPFFCSLIFTNGMNCTQIYLLLHVMSINIFLLSYSFLFFTLQNFCHSLFIKRFYLSFFSLSMWCGLPMFEYIKINVQTNPIFRPMQLICSNTTKSILNGNFIMDMGNYLADLFADAIACPRNIPNWNKKKKSIWNCPITTTNNLK